MRNTATYVWLVFSNRERVRLISNDVCTRYGNKFPKLLLNQEFAPPNLREFLHLRGTF